MKKYAILIFGAAAMFYSASVSAQGLSVGVGPGGAGVRIDDGYGRDRGYREGRRYGRSREYRRGRNEVVVIKRRGWDGRRPRYNRY